MQRIVIIGAGLTGLSAAYHLEQLGHQNIAIFEQEASVGGLTRSFSKDGFTFDYTGHFLHSNNAYFSDFLEKVFATGELQAIERVARIFINNTFMSYPFQTNVTQLSKELFCECVEGFIKRPRLSQTPKNFKQWLLTAFGKGMCKHFFYPYNKKILSYPPHKAMAEQGGRFVPNTSLSDILSPLQDTSTKNVGYNTHFLYPHRGGIQSFSTNITKKLLTKPRTNTTIAHIDPYKKILHLADGSTEPYDMLISTMPLDSLLQKTSFGSNSNLSHQAKNLVCNTVINLNIGVNRPFITANHWMYFPEKKYSFYRLGCWSAISQSLAPAQTSSLYAEISALYPTEKELARKITRTRRDALSLFGISPNEICIEKTLILKHAYVIYDAWRKTNLPPLLETLKSTFNIHSVGRFGAWKYSSMQEAILDGKQTAEEVLPSVVTHPSHSPILMSKQEQI